MSAHEHWQMDASGPELYERFTVQDLTPPRALVDTFRHGYPIVAAVTQPDLHPDGVARMLEDVESTADYVMAHSASPPVYETQYQHVTVSRETFGPECSSSPNQPCHENTAPSKSWF